VHAAAMSATVVAASMSASVVAASVSATVVAAAVPATVSAMRSKHRRWDEQASGDRRREGEFSQHWGFLVCVVDASSRLLAQ
jgi:hypothetical protein